MDDQDTHRGTRCIGEGRSANHFELAFTGEEFLLDFGQAYDEAKEPWMHTRILVTPRNAATLSSMLADLVERYRQHFPFAHQETS